MADTVQNRLLSLDVFRGITIAGMTLVNNPGSWEHIYWPLDHAEWNGLTPTDWVFPFFLFIVGVAIAIALGKRVEEGVTRSAYTKIFSRFVLIYALGLATSVVPFFNFSKTDAPEAMKMAIWLLFAASIFFLLLRNYLVGSLLAAAAVISLAAMQLGGYNIVLYHYETIRIPGVLQRIAVCYLVTSLIFLHTNWKQQLGIGIVLLIAYWIVMTTISVPGCEVTTMNDKTCNLAAYIDRMIITVPHIWSQGKVYDPEGILSTIPAIVTCLSGVLAGTWLKTKRDDYQKVSGILFFGVVLFALGWICNSFFPINKALWTSSYVLATSGLALLMLGCCYWLIDIKGYKAWAKPFIIFGANALALFVFSAFFSRMLSALHVTGSDGQRISIGEWIYNNVFLALFQPINASLAFAICFILLWLFLMWLLYRKKIYIRV
jgi:predicted acyltransferase